MPGGENSDGGDQHEEQRRHQRAWRQIGQATDAVPAGTPRTQSGPQTNQESRRQKTCGTFPGQGGRNRHPKSSRNQTNPDETGEKGPLPRRSTGTKRTAENTADSSDTAVDQKQSRRRRADHDASDGGIHQVGQDPLLAFVTVQKRQPKPIPNAISLSLMFASPPPKLNGMDPAPLTLWGKAYNA